MTIKTIARATGIPLLLLSLCSASFADSHSETKPEKKTEKAVVAIVNGTEITQDVLTNYLGVVQRSENNKKNDPRSALDDLVATELALQEAAKTDILSRPDVQQRIKDFTRNVLLTTWTKEKVEGFDVSDEAIQKSYDERIKKDANDEFKARHILLKTEEDANAVIKSIADGEDFIKLAETKSTGPSAANGGDLGWFKSSTMVKEFADAVKAMKKGDTSTTPVKTNFGWHIIKLEDLRPANLPPMKTVKPQLKRMLAQQKMMAYMEKMKESAQIKILLPETTAETTETAKTE
ncbi:MAG: peptidylprolyl isomerase [Leucothrix sp.]